MKIAILGYGKMGKEVEICAKKQGFNISKVITSKDNLKDIAFDTNEIVIDFTNRDAFLTYLPILAKKKVNIVTGTTGWYDKLQDIKNIVIENNIGFLYSSNFSLGMHIFKQIVNYATNIVSKLHYYSIDIKEIHHINKIDSPSGSALTLKDLISQYVNYPINIESFRENNVIGEHIVNINSDKDIIQLSHIAKERDIFAKGALEAAKWIMNKKGFFTLDEMLSI